MSESTIETRDTGTIEADATYVGRIISARFISPFDSDKAPKIDVCVEVLNAEGHRLGVLNEYLYLSVRALRRLKEFLIAAGIIDDESCKTFRPSATELCELLPQQMVGVVTREAPSTTEDGGMIIAIASFLNAEEGAEQYANETGKGQE